MPVAFDTTETYRYVISTDRKKDNPPTLLFNYPTVKETRIIANLFDSGGRASSIDESMTLRCDAVRVILCGWENFTDRKGKPIPYNPDDLDSVLSDNDISELEARLLREMSQSEMDKKKAVLFAQSSSASAAPNVTASA